MEVLNGITDADLLLIESLDSVRRLFPSRTPTESPKLPLLGCLAEMCGRQPVALNSHLEELSLFLVKEENFGLANLFWLLRSLPFRKDNCQSLPLEVL